MEEFDYISEFPDCLLTQILLNLPTKDSVKTSVLSKRWRNLWLNVPGLRLRTFDFPVFPYPYEEGFVRFMDRFMEFKCRSRLQKFMITYFEHNGYRDRLMELIGTLVDRGIQHLYVYMHTCNRVDFIRQNIYKSKTLVSLKLYNVELKNPEFVVSLPCLKILKLENIFHGEDGPLVVEKLISGCPVLEDLELIRPFDDNVGYGSLTAPKYSRNRDIIGDFLTVISSVRHTIICYSTSKMLYSYSKQLGPIPQFHNLYHLQARFSSSSLQLLPTFLESCPACPNLKNLIMEFPFEPKNIDFHKVPQCLISTLEYVQIEELILKEKSGIKLVDYFLENSAVLKKLTLSFTYHSKKKQDPESYKKLLTSTKLSPTCQIIID
ncbi:F-box/RNI-like superfamily protein [Arabidopsis thaliana]|uniref:Putative FBD-associated F-box protein At5g44940 n=1 Tax=Arabidopsis thaliana TaxID=3702 RepID=FBD42_ARATH|nr:F-box/RNI-like superfamily protein [Arabidopsis thaliana]Q9FLA3.2 RecName: Full=Putative FBD-associated F-box protein At5g44940 [Arabidopsis thaliana]AED95178.1 F-box/RNI-like superfamily protein [Arabidopsis thaliana]|eukprot:NP_199307.2 F-box/RNI-like superfamily protein [Arabidopsis thaliana]